MYNYLHLGLCSQECTVDFSHSLLVKNSFFSGCIILYSTICQLKGITFLLSLQCSGKHLPMLYFYEIDYQKRLGQFLIWIVFQWKVVVIYTTTSNIWKCFFLLRITATGIIYFLKNMSCITLLSLICSSSYLWYWYLFLI